MIGIDLMNLNQVFQGYLRSRYSTHTNGLLEEKDQNTERNPTKINVINPKTFYLKCIYDENKKTVYFV